jgi:hypothetical protein
VALALIGAAYVFGQASLDRPAAPRPSLASTGRPVPPLTARDLLNHASELDLTVAQRTRLAALDRTWTEEAKGLDQAVAAARAEFERFAREAGSRGVSVAEIRRQSAEYREVSAALRAARERHAAAALAALTEAERQGVARGRFTSVPGGER